MPWYFYALLSAVAAAATAILAKLGVEGVPSTVATAVRTVVVLVLAWAVVLSAGHQRVLPTISGRSLVFLTLSGVATAVSWLAYFRALQMAPASLVAPIDKLSLPFTIMRGPEAHPNQLRIPPLTPRRTQPQERCRWRREGRHYGRPDRQCHRFDREPARPALRLITSSPSLFESAAAECPARSASKGPARARSPRTARLP